MTFTKDIIANTGIGEIVLEQIIDIAKQHGVHRLILFGSRARGNYKERSDIDLAFAGGDSAAFIYDTNENTDTLLNFDIVDLGQPTSSELLESIQKEGLIIYEKI